MPRTRAPCWGDISFTGTRLSTRRRWRSLAGAHQNHRHRRRGGLRRDRRPGCGTRGRRRARASFEAGPGCGTRGRRGPDTPEPQAPPVRSVPEGPEAWLRCPWAAARPGRASRSTTPSRQARVWRSRGRAAAHGRTKQPGPTAGSDGARNTSGATDTSTDTGTGTKAGRNLSVPARPRCSVVVGAARQVSALRDR